MVSDSMLPFVSRLLAGQSTEAYSREYWTKMNNQFAIEYEIFPNLLTSLCLDCATFRRVKSDSQGRLVPHDMDLALSFPVQRLIHQLHIIFPAEFRKDQI